MRLLLKMLMLLASIMREGMRDEHARLKANLRANIRRENKMMAVSSMILAHHIHLPRLTMVLDFTAIAIGAIGGTMHARRHPKYEYDIIGAFGLALVSALGGGVARDVLLGQGPPLALENLGYLWVALGAAAVTLLIPAKGAARLERALRPIDAAAIALFAVAGTTRAQSFGLAWLPSLMLGITTAVGGGSLRDVLSGTTPRVFERGNFYAIAALVAGGSYLLLDRTELPDTWCVVIAVALGFHCGWRVYASTGGRMRCEFRGSSRQMRARAVTLRARKYTKFARSPLGRDSEHQFPGIRGERSPTKNRHACDERGDGAVFHGRLPDLPE